MGSKAIIASSLGFAIISLMLVQSIGPAIVNIDSQVAFTIIVDKNSYALGEQVPFNITVTKGSFLKYVVYFHDGTNTTTDGSSQILYHRYAKEGHYLVGIFGFATTNYDYPVDILRAVEVTIINGPPKVAISTNTTSTFESTAVNFSISSFNDTSVKTPNPTYQWIFGDGSNVTTTQTSIDHSYTNAGTYNVLAYATDSLGQIAMANTTVTVAGTAPAINIATNSTTILEGQTVRFDASQTKVSPAEQPTLAYGWNFGDGNMGSGSIVTETYEHPGSYTATLTVSDQLGASVQKSLLIQVVNINPTITNMTLSNQTIPEGQTLIGFGQASDAQVDLPRLNYNWQFATQSGTGRITSFTPFQPENTTALLSVTDTSGVTVRASKPVSVVNEPPQASIVGAIMNFNLTVIITGDKWKAINIQLLNENNVTAINNTLVRQAGDPWSMDLTYYNINLDLTHVWRFVTEYTPNSTATNGADPVSLYLNLTNDNNVYYQIYNFTFNVQQPNWYTWVLPLDPFTNRLPVGWIVNYFDPGETALTITLDDNSSLGTIIPAKKIGSQSGTVLFYATVMANTSIPIKLTIADQYGLATSTYYQVDAPLNSTMGYRLTQLAPLINRITSSAMVTNSTVNFTGYEESLYEFSVNATQFYKDASSLQYVWTFGDGQTLTTTKPSITHMYTYAGLYEVTVRVVSTGTKLSTTQSILVKIQPILPTMQIDAPNERWVKVGQPINLDVSNATAVTSEQPLLFYWSLNDTSSISYTGHTAKFNYEFFHQGTFFVQVFAVGAEGAISNYTYLFHVSDTAPTVTISQNQAIQGLEGEAIQLNPQIGTTAIQLPYLKYTWQIGNTIYHQKFVNRYFTYGTYIGTLTVQDAGGLQNTNTVNITIEDHVPIMASLVQIDYGIKSPNYRVVFTTSMSNLDFGYYSYRVSGAWILMKNNVINTTFNLQNYRDGNVLSPIEIKDHAGKQFPQNVNITTIGDSNGDNIRDSNESILGSTPNGDYDGDGITDFTEITGWNINVLLAGRTTPVTMHVTSNPTLPSTDGCLPDSVVYRLGGDPHAIGQSTAQDGITDCQKAAVGLPLNVAINPQTTISGSLNINPSATSDQNTWTVTVQVLDGITGNPIVPYKMVNSKLEYTTHNTIDFYNATNYYIGSCYLDNSSSCTFSYGSYQDSITANFSNNGLYNSAGVTLRPNYNTSDLLHNLGPGSDQVSNAMGYILKRYVESSGAFNPNSDGSYTMNGVDANQTWTYDGHLLGYFIPATVSVLLGHTIYDIPNYPTFTQNELETYQYNNVPITVINYTRNLNGNFVPETISVPKSQLLFDWLGLKLLTVQAQKAPPLLSNAYETFYQVAQNLTDLTGLNQQSYKPSPVSRGCGSTTPAGGVFNSNSLDTCSQSPTATAYMIIPDSITKGCTSDCSNGNSTNGGGSDTVVSVNTTILASSVQAALKLTTQTGIIHVVYPQTSSCSGIFNYLICAIQGVINTVINVAKAIISITIGVIDFVIKAWNDVVAPFLGTVVHVVKDVINGFIQSIINTIMQPILSGQTTSLNTIFGGVSPDTIASYGPSVFSNIETTINSESSQLANVGSTMGSMMSSLSVFSGAGTILGPLISVAGPGIMVRVISMIASVIMNSVLSPLFSQFTSTVLSNDLDTLMAPLGGTATGALAILNNIAGLTSVTSQPGAVSQNSGSGYMLQSTGSAVGTGGTGNSLSSVGSSTGTCDVTAIGTCLASEFNTELLLGQTVLDNSNGAFRPFLTVVGDLVTAMETLTGSSSTQATSAVAPTKAISSSLTTSTSAAMSKSDYTLLLGGIAALKDVGGIAKTIFSNAIINTSIQFARTVADSVQLYLSVEYNHDYPSSIAPELWVVKSLISGLTNFASLCNDVNKVIPQSWTSSITKLFPSLSFSKITQALRAVLQGAGAVVFILFYFGHSSSIPFLTKIFMGLYVAQKVAKFALFFLKLIDYINAENLNPEKGLYALSMVLNILQMDTG